MASEDHYHLYLNTVVAIAQAKCNKDKPIPGLDTKYLYEGDKAITGIAIRPLIGRPTAITDETDMKRSQSSSSSSTTSDPHPESITKSIYPGFRNIDSQTLRSYPPGHSWLPPPVEYPQDPDFKEKMEDILVKMVPRDQHQIVLSFVFYTWDIHNATTFIHQLHAYGVAFPSNVVSVRIVHMRGVMKTTTEKLAKWPMNEIQPFGNRDVVSVITLTDILNMLQSTYSTYSYMSWKHDKQTSLVNTAHSTLVLRANGAPYDYIATKIHSRPDMVIHLPSLNAAIPSSIIKKINAFDTKLNYQVIIENLTTPSTTITATATTEEYKKAVLHEKDPLNESQTQRTRAKAVARLSSGTDNIDNGFLGLNNADIHKLQLIGINTVGDIARRASDPVFETINSPLLMEFLAIYRSQ